MKRLLAIGGFFVVLLLAMMRADAQDATLNVKISGQGLGTLNDANADFKTDNAFYKSGYVGAGFVIEITDTTITVNVVDPHNGEAVRTIFEFDTVTRVSTGPTTERFFALGTDMIVDGIPNAKFGNVSFTEAVLTGTIELDGGGAPAKVSAKLEATGESDGGTVLLSAKVKGNTVFVPVP